MKIRIKAIKPVGKRIRFVRADWFTRARAGVLNENRATLMPANVKYVA